jgi:hypothetical protein
MRFIFPSLILYEIIKRRLTRIVKPTSYNSEPPCVIGNVADFRLLFITVEFPMESHRKGRERQTWSTPASLVGIQGISSPV